MDVDILACALTGLLLSIVVLLVYAFGTALYKIYFHPLSKYPGPFLCKLTDVYFAYMIYRGDVHVWLFEMQKRYVMTYRNSHTSFTFAYQTFP